MYSGAAKTDWHYVRIRKTKMGTYKWMNAAGNVWTLYPTSNCAVMGLEVGKDCPYYDFPSAGYYRSAMYNENGIFGPVGEFYTFIGKSD